MKFYSLEGKEIDISQYPGYCSTKYINWTKEKSGNLPVLYKSKEDCCGCFACFSVCPSNAIEMNEDIEGFVYPNVNVEKCIGCHQCERICPIKTQQEESKSEI
jgi:ferredoxin